MKLKGRSTKSKGGLTLSHPGRYQPSLFGGMHQPIPNFLTFPNLIPTFICWSNFSFFFANFCEKNAVKIFLHPKKERFFDKNGQKHCFLTNIGIFCFNYVISMLWEIFWGALHVCRSKIDDVENSFYIRHIFESPQPWGCSWRGYASQKADQELKWKLRTLFVWEIQVLEFLETQSWPRWG